MPQMMPLNWVLLYFMFNTILYIFMINNYFNLTFTSQKIQSPQSNYSKSFHDFWPLN